MRENLHRGEPRIRNHGDLAILEEDPIEGVIGGPVVLFTEDDAECQITEEEMLSVLHEGSGFHCALKERDLRGDEYL